MDKTELNKRMQEAAKCGEVDIAGYYQERLRGLNNKEFQKCIMDKQGCTSSIRNCATCGFDVDEAERRKKLPLETDENGIRKKVIRRATQK